MSDDELAIRSSHEVANRYLAIMAILGKVYEAPPMKTMEWVKKHNIEELLSHEEAAFFNNPRPEQAEIVKFSWRAESMVPLVWAMSAIAELPPLNSRYDPSQCPCYEPASNDPISFRAKALLRPRTILLAAEEDLYHNHWRVRDAQLFNKPMPPELNPDIVYERRYAMSWLVGWGEDWDEVPTDT
jgi:hypothetical protein